MLYIYYKLMINHAIVLK